MCPHAKIQYLHTKLFHELKKQFAFQAVIGAGAAGLVAARELSREGHQVTVLEQGSQVGGVWVYTDAYEAEDLLGKPAWTVSRLHTLLLLTSCILPLHTIRTLLGSFWGLETSLKFCQVLRSKYIAFTTGLPLKMFAILVEKWLPANGAFERIWNRGQGLPGVTHVSSVQASTKAGRRYMAVCIRASGPICPDTSWLTQIFLLISRQPAPTTTACTVATKRCLFYVLWFSQNPSSGNSAKAFQLWLAQGLDGHSRG